MHLYEEPLYIYYYNREQNNPNALKVMPYQGIQYMVSPGFERNTLKHVWTPSGGIGVFMKGPASGGDKGEPGSFRSW
jgi:hypothetical protein